MTKPAAVLVVEDQASERRALERLLRMEGYRVLTAGNPQQALEHLASDVGLVISDLRLGAESGLALFRAWRQQRPETAFILVTAYADVPSAVAAMKLGAVDYLTKPVNPEELLVLARQALGQRAEAGPLAPPPRVGEPAPFGGLLGSSPVMREVCERLARAAASDSLVLLSGESGTGKELAAEAIHRHSQRKNGPYVAVNMAAIPANLVESELFGHVAGAFTSAYSSRAGKFEAAHGGTLFIDEIGDFDLPAQAKLLRVLESWTVTPLGSNEERRVDVRVVAATRTDLAELVAAGRFREDLYYRLNVIAIELPPLRERPGDVPLLIGHFLGASCRAHQRPLLALDPELERFLAQYSWPGNVRQLKNALESMVVLARGDTLTLDDLPAHVRAADAPGEPPPAAALLEGTLDELERAATLQALERYEGNRFRAAESLGISVRTLQRRLKAWGDEGRREG